MKTKEKLRFSIPIDGGHRKLKKNVIGCLERRVGNFIEVINDKGEYDYRVDFRLGGGMYYNYLITELISDEEEGIGALKWILSKEFPEEIKIYIIRLMKKKHLLDEELLEQLEEDYAIKTKST
jgi:hypothetical protein